eukprot:1158112-Pelagomonas_calceolata.AAC.3
MQKTASCVGIQNPSAGKGPEKSCSYCVGKCISLLVTKEISCPAKANGGCRFFEVLGIVSNPNAASCQLLPKGMSCSTSLKGRMHMPRCLSATELKAILVPLILEVEQVKQLAAGPGAHTLLFIVKQLAEGPDAPALLLIVNPQWDERGELSIVMMGRILLVLQAASCTCWVARMSGKSNQSEGSVSAWARLHRLGHAGFCIGWAA